MKNGEDILAQQENNSDFKDYISIVAPVSIHIDPVHGFFAKSWLLLSEENSMKLNRNETIFCHNASEKAKSYYEEFLFRITEEEPQDESEEYTSELEEVFEAMMEAKTRKLN